MTTRDQIRERLHDQGHNLISDLAELIAGLQVPRSISDGVSLGAGRDAWDRLWGQHLNVLGWKNRSEVEYALRQALGGEIAHALGNLSFPVGDPFPCPRCRSTLLSRDFSQCANCGHIPEQYKEDNK